MTLFPKNGLYLSPFPSEHAFYCAMTEGLGHPFALSENQPAEESFYINNINPVLSKYVPGLSGVRPASMYAGRQDWSSTDKNPYIFEVGNAVVALASSGNGISKGDAIGRAVATVSRGAEVAELYGGERFEVSKLGIAGRIIERETFALH
jgi:glycine/D-amino acid oxidase-like deaminating enzyme